MISRSCLLVSLASLSLLLPLRPAHAQGDLIDGMAAVVNTEVITFSQVRELAAARERTLRTTYRGQELIDRTKEARLDALKDLIDRQLILQAFAKDKLTIPDRIIDERVQTLIREEFGGDRTAFIRTLQAQGFTLTRFRESEKDKIIIQAMRQRNVRSNMVIAPQRIEAVYNERKAQYTTPEQIKLRMIVLKQKNAETGEDQKAIAEEIRSKLEGGTDFEHMAQLYSEDSNKEVGGDWGWIDRKTLNADLTKYAFGQKTGVISPVITYGDSYYLMFVEARKNASTKPLSEMKGDIEKQLLQEERQKAQQKWLDSLRAKAYIKMF